MSWLYIVVVTSLSLLSMLSVVGILHSVAEEEPKLVLASSVVFTLAVSTLIWMVK